MLASWTTASTLHDNGFQVQASAMAVPDQVQIYGVQVSRAPAGSLSLPYSVGNNGPIFHSNLMIWF